MLLTLAMTLSLAGVPQAQSETVARRPAGAIAAMMSARRYSNTSLNRFLEDRDERAGRRAVIDQRANLAEHLDRLIGSGDCPQAKQVALRYGYSDIVEQVDIVCETRGRDAQTN